MIIVGACKVTKIYVPVKNPICQQDGLCNERASVKREAEHVGAW